MYTTEMSFYSGHFGNMADNGRYAIFDDSFKLTRAMLASIGYDLSFPGSKTTLQTNRKRLVLFAILKYSAFAMVGGGMTLQLVYAAQAIGNSANFLDVTSIAPCVGVCILCLAKMATVHGKSVDLFALVQKLKTMWPHNLKNEVENNAVYVHMKQARTITTAFAVLYVTVICVFIMTPIAEMSYNSYFYGRHEYVLAYVMWRPLDVTVPYGFTMSYLFDAISSFILTFGTVGVDGLFVMINSHICMQLSLLESSLRDIARNESAGAEFDSKKQDDLNDALAKCVMHHNALIRFSVDLEEIYSPSILVNFLGSSVVICLIGFQLTVVTGINMFKYVTFLASSMLQIFMLCRSGNQLIVTSSGVCDAAYQSTWYVTDVRFRRSLLILMMRAQRPLKLTAMKFSTVSLASFTTIVSSSYSYFTLLRTVYGKV